MMRFKLFFVFLLLTIGAWATHNRAGYIGYTYNAATGKYHFRIYTYTNPTSVSADRCYQTLLIMDPFGNIIDSINCTRINGTANLVPQGLANCPGDPGATSGWGEMLVSTYSLSSPPGSTYGGVKYNIYDGDRERALNPGKYILGMIDPNLDDNVNNIPSSGSVAFALMDTISTNNGVGLSINNTPLVTNPPIDNACLHQTFCYNPGMIDPDNDSLAYSLIPFMTGNAGGSSGHLFMVTPGAFIPPNISVNPITGQLCWVSPWLQQQIGEYDIDMLIKEYRRNPIDGSRYLIGSTVFAVQIYVNNCTGGNNNVSMNLSATNACIIAGSNYTSPVITASESGGSLSISATGLALTATNIGTNAVFSGSTNSSNSASGTLSWLPNCQAVQLNPYYVTVRGSDSSKPQNTGYATITLKVVAPPIQNLTANVQGDSIKLSWLPPLNCSGNTFNSISSYLIYRVSGCSTFAPNPCQTGVPPSSGFQLIGTAPAGANPVFYDTNNGLGLPAGNTYSYIVIAKFADGSLSIANPGNAACVTLHFGVPILTNVSVDTTNTQYGRISIRWKKPVLGAVNFDTTKAGNGGPYYFTLSKLDASGTYTTVVYTSPTRAYFSLLNNASDTTYTDTLLDTQNKSYYYKVYFYASGGRYAGNSAPASSIFVSGVGHNRKVILNWTAQTPWQDTLYYIYQQNYTNSGYHLVGTTHATTDTVYGLSNNYPCCFKIQSAGTYMNPYVQSPLYNFSQKICVTPIDDEPPCQPTLSINGNCDAATNQLSWTNPNHSCHVDDVVKYYIYYTARQDSLLTKIDSLLNPNDTLYTTKTNTLSIAGCYIIVAVDSAGNQSALNNESCTDNCPEYELPNIFTPNNDNVNDSYIPVKNRYIKSVDFVMYNRWGEVVYENSNPALGWDGKTKQMKQPAPDGTYFYTCTYYEIHYYGLVEKKIKGFVQLIR
ncbi:MAG: gliding motility-associated C-terminal domain-containing protein [Bacteroidetes bacterium]|nr:gliding motility-associated C-terminal domain-containing protein [Bacteroidota bacterium]